MHWKRNENVISKHDINHDIKYDINTYDTNISTSMCVLNALTSTMRVMLCIPHIEKMFPRICVLSNLIKNPEHETLLKRFIWNICLEITRKLRTIGSYNVKPRVRQSFQQK